MRIPSWLEAVPALHSEAVYIEADRFFHQKILLAIGRRTIHSDPYLKSGARAQAGPKMQSNYTLLQSFNAKGQMRIVIDDEVEAVKGRGPTLRLPVQSMRAAPSSASLATLSRGKSPERGEVAENSVFEHLSISNDLGC